MPPQSEGPSECSGMRAILLVFQADSKHEEITDVYMGLVVCRVESHLYVYMGLVVCRVESHLYAPDQILNFVKDIEANLQVVHDTLKAGGNPGKRHGFCLFVDNFSSTMSVPMDPPYCLVYSTSYIKGVELDHFNTHNSPGGMHLHHCICHSTLQFSNDDPQGHTNYARSHLILPHGVQYNDQLYLAILEPWNHRSPLIDPVTGEPCPMEMVSDFKAADLIFKECYGDSLLYSDTDLCQLRWRKIHLPAFQGEIPMPPAPPTSRSGSPR